MAINYPASLDNGTSLPNPTATQDTNSPSLSAGQGLQNDAVIALETKLGTGASTPSGTYALVSTGTGSSSWSLATPTGTIVGTSDTQTLTNKTIDASNNTISNLSGSDLASNTITATQIANATITATQIANATITATQIANATITATQIASGTITATQIANGGIDYTNLLSTIFSGQVQSFTNTGTGGGTFYYIDMGGLKILTGETVDATSAPTLVYPSGLFTTWASATYSLANVSTLPSGAIFWTNGSAATNEIVVNVAGQPSGLSFRMSFMVIGV